ncbi:MAG: ABC transporter permease [Tetrasphaera sp.]
MGETLEVAAAAGARKLTITGLYQDITNGGKTAKAVDGPTRDDPHPGVTIAIGLREASSAPDVARAVTTAVPGVNVIDTGEYLRQMMADLIRVMSVLAWVFSVVAVAIAALIAGMSIRLMLTQERKSTAVMGAMGFTSTDLRSQFLLRILSMVAIGVLVAILAAGPVGNAVADVIFSTVNVSGLKLVFSPVSTALGAALVLASAWLVTAINTRANFNSALADRLKA